MQAEIQNIYELLEGDEIEQALKNFLKLCRDTEHYKTALAINSSFKEYNKDKIAGKDISGKKENILSRLSEALDQFTPDKGTITFTKNITVPTKGDFGFAQNIVGFDGVILMEEKIFQPKKILFLSANSKDDDMLRLDEEMRQLDLELTKAAYREKFELEKSSALRISDLQDKLLNFAPQVVHFAGHGSQQGIFVLDEFGGRKIIESEALANLFKLFADTVECVVLNSCYSEVQAKAIRQFIPLVIGMNVKINDQSAIEFSKAFYKALGAGKEMPFAFDFAKNSMDLQGLSGADLPVLL